ncbi:hypothetical protein F511_16500 [Dorcoceras hygrometricum]|uniref:Dystroglycan-like n=1 Tax=Dorcoceras hygrometricum TaxID=472368 RepID=A0A2Z7BQE8_9LAMI|nr:hypothetical protein F511_16500 [Dorcoceras hygrometricum]
MASSLISNSHHIDFDSVFDMDDAGLAQVFETLIATGLRNFFGCPAVFYEEALLEFFTNGSVREDGMVVSTIRGTTVEISESFFATAFDLPTEGLTDLSDVPKDKIFHARSLFSASKEQVSVSCFKKEMKIEYRLSHDILAKTIFVKAGSFDAVTRDRFLLMTAITFDVKVNWGSLLFSVLKGMVTPGSRKAKGFAIKIGVLLQNVQGLMLGESKGFPKSRILDAKTVQRREPLRVNLWLLLKRPCLLKLMMLLLMHQWNNSLCPNANLRRERGSWCWKTLLKLMNQFLRLWNNQLSYQLLRVQLRTQTLLLTKF